MDAQRPQNVFYVCVDLTTEQIGTHGYVFSRSTLCKCKAEKKETLNLFDLKTQCE